MRRPWNRVIETWAWGAVLAALFGGCSPPARRENDVVVVKSGAVSRARVAELRARENRVRAQLTPATQPAWIDVSGADPLRLSPLPSGKGYVGILRGSKALVVLDSELRELGRAALSESPTALCLNDGGQAWVASRYGNQLLRFEVVESGAIVKRVEVDLPFAAVADVACARNGLVHVQAVDGSTLATFDERGQILGSFRGFDGPLRLRRSGDYLLELSLFERSLRALAVGPRGLPEREVGRIGHDGTLWAMDAAALPGTNDLLVAVAGVEDKALVRAHGEFENIDSYVWLYRLGVGGFAQLAALDVSDFGAVVPKALQLEVTAEQTSLHVLSAGGGQALHVTWLGGYGGAPQVGTEPAPPGVSEGLWERDRGWVYASPLFDAWIRLRAGAARFARVDPERRPEPNLRLGEALFFTELIAPENTSVGTHSRFSCETCHLDGGVDGRTHYTGRGEVSVVTKPLFGLANNRPHFSRALDPDLSSVSHNEFRVAGAGSGTDPWFTLDSARFPWLHELGIERGVLAPLELRGALLEFLYAFSHAPNPQVRGRTGYSPLEAEGARAFAAYCERCHAPRLVSDDPTSRVPFDRWQDLIFSRNTPIVWATGDYAKTGVLPYVHERGTRVTSLRRLALKPRYFTNGSAPSLAAVVERFRAGPDAAWHVAPTGSGGALSSETRRALTAFLRLL